MLSPGAGRRPTSVEDLVGADLMARLDRLDVASRQVFPGRLPGERRSKKRGRSVEFADYRTYTAGDDLRHIDWNVFARLDRLFIKLFQEEEDLSLHLVVDASASMDAGHPSKLLFALRVAMALGYLGLVRRNRVSASVFGLPGPMRAFQSSRGRTSVQRLGAFLLEVGEARHGAGVGDAPREDFTEAMKRAAQQPAGGGAIVLLSDFLAPEGYEDGLRALSARRGFDIYCAQVLSPGEIDPDAEGGATRLSGDLRLIDAETGSAREVTITPSLVKRYKANLESFCAGLEQFCLARSMQYLRTPSDADVESLLLDHFRRRGLLK
ncbi:MAG: DUF58 domain-containing protein [Phycisphaerales bacterium]